MSYECTKVDIKRLKFLGFFFINVVYMYVCSRYCDLV